MAHSVEKEIGELRSLFWSDRDPDGRAFVPLAEAYRQIGDLELALEVLQDGLGRHSDFAPGHVVAGWVRRARGEPELAKAAFSSALALDDENTEALRGLAAVAVERGEGALAADCWRRLVELEPGDGELRERLAEAEGMSSAPPEVATIAVDDAPWGEPDATASAEPESVADDPWGEPERVRATDEVASGVDEVVLTAEEIVLDVGEPADATEADVRIEHEPAEVEPFADASAPSATSGRAPVDADPWASPVRAPTGDGEDGPVTRTMADLYARQNLHARALRLYRQMHQRAPGDAALAERVREMEALAAALEGGAAGTALAIEAEAPPAAASSPVPIEDLAPSPSESAAETPPAAPESSRGAPRATARPARRPSDDEVEALARDWAEGPGDTSELSTPFAWATRPPEPKGAITGGRPIGDYFRTLLEWEPGVGVAPPDTPPSDDTPPVSAVADAEPLEQVVDEALVAGEAVVEEPMASAWVAEARVEEAVVEVPLEPSWVEAVDVEPIEAEAVEDERVIVAIESLAPDAPAASADPEPALVVPIESLAPRIVDIASLAPAKSSDDDFSGWLQRL